MRYFRLKIFTPMNGSRTRQRKDEPIYFVSKTSASLFRGSSSDLDPKSLLVRFFYIHIFMKRGVILFFLTILTTEEFSFSSKPSSTDKIFVGAKFQQSNPNSRNPTLPLPLTFPTDSSILSAVLCFHLL